MVNTEIRLIIFFAAKDGEGLYSQQKQGWELTVVQIMNSLLQNSDLAPKPKGTNQLTADDRVSDSGGAKRGKERARAAPRPHFTPAILRSRCGHAGSLRAAQPRPPSTAQQWKAPRASQIPYPRGGEEAT